MTVIQYVTEEVERQGHDTTALDGIQRVGWMLEAWAYAIERAYGPGGVNKPTAWDAIRIGCLVEPHKNSAGLRVCEVRVGLNKCPPPEDVERLLLALFARGDTLTPLDFYRAFEEVHPFIDGNGRSGKILMSWISGSLFDPVFPSDDFWGRPIRNP